jgi:protein-disulfide isomerase
MDIGNGRPAVGRKIKSVLDSLATIAIIIAAGVLIWRNWPKSPNGAPLPSLPLSLGDAAITGNAAAPVAIIEYSDFQCPYCGQFARTTLRTLEARYVRPGQVLLAFRHLPLENLHPLAFKAAEASECARRQGKFWEMHDRSFESQKQLDEASLLASAEAIGLDMARFRTCLAGQATEQVRKDIATAGELKITGPRLFSSAESSLMGESG